jgi:hypothetical protein
MINMSQIQSLINEVRAIQKIISGLESGIEELQISIVRASKVAEGFPADVVMPWDGDFRPLTAELSALADCLDCHLAISVDIPADDKPPYFLGDASILTELQRIDEMLEAVLHSRALQLYHETLTQFPELGNNTDEHIT